jgi:hypothetical protein
MHAKEGKGKAKEEERKNDRKRKKRREDTKIKQERRRRKLKTQRKKNECLTEIQFSHYESKSLVSAVNPTHSPQAENLTRDREEVPENTVYVTLIPPLLDKVVSGYSWNLCAFHCRVTNF